MIEQRSAHAQTIGDTGRYVLEAGGNLFVSDSGSGRVGPVVAPEPAHYLLSALAACALGSVDKQARESEIAFVRATADVTSVRDEVDRTRFSSIDMQVAVYGVTQEQAQHLVNHFTSNCAIYNTVRRGGPISVTVIAHP